MYHRHLINTLMHYSSLSTDNRLLLLVSAKLGATEKLQIVSLKKAITVYTLQDQVLKQEIVHLMSCTQVLLSKSCKMKWKQKQDTNVLSIHLQVKAMELNSIYICVIVCVSYLKPILM